jgi:two-component system, chemotaxis family, chemotaxis protein CheY
MPNLLVADDSLFQRHIIGRIAREAGFTMIEAQSGQECLDLALTQPVAGVVLDLNMPDRNGFEVLQQLKEAAFARPVIVLSADIQETSRRRCLELGARDFFSKPVDEPRLRERLRELLS